MPVRVPDIPGLTPTAIDAPQASPRAAAAPAQALGEVAQGLSSIGQAFGEYAEQVQNAENQHALSTTRSKLDEMRAAHFLEMDRISDPAERLKATDVFLQNAKQIAQDPTHAPVVRDRLAIYFDEWATDTRTTNADRVERLTRQRADLASRSELDLAVGQGDLTRANAILDERVANGLDLPEQADQVRTQLGRQSTFRAITRQIDEEPLDATDQLDDPDFLARYPDLHLEDVDRLRDYAERARNTAAADLWDQTLNAAQDGVTLSAEDLSDLASQGLITPTQRASYARAYLSGQPVAADPALYDSLHSAVMAYNPAADPTGIGLANLRAELATVPLPPEHLKELQSRLSNQATPAGSRTSRHRLSADFSKITDERFDAGQFGAWFSMDGSAKVIDRPAFEDAIVRKREFLDAWQSYLAAAPDDLDPAQARQTYDTLFESLVTDRDDFSLLSDDLFAPGADYGAEVDALLGGMDDGPGVLPPKPPEQTSFGGQPIRRMGEYYPDAGVSVFGGTADPADNGLSAFGGTTGAGGKEGVAIPRAILDATFPGKNKKWFAENVRVIVRTPQGGSHTFPVADLGTAEWVWEKKGRPVLDFTPGALRQVGGRVLRDETGAQRGVTGIDKVSFALTTIDAGMPLQGADWEDVWTKWFQQVKPNSPDQIDTARKALLAAYLEANYSGE